MQGMVLNDNFLLGVLFPLFFEFQREKLLVGPIGSDTLQAQFTEYIHKLFQGPPFRLAFGG
jgi:hypothetical protein